MHALLAKVYGDALHMTRIDDICFLLRFLQNQSDSVVPMHVCVMVRGFENLDRPYSHNPFTCSTEISVGMNLALVFILFVFLFSQHAHFSLDLGT